MATQGRPVPAAGEMPGFPIVEVVWTDAERFNGWHSEMAWDALLNDETEAANCRSVGFLFRQDGRHIVLAQSANVVGETADILVIPAGMVRQMTALRGVLPDGDEA